MISISFWVQLVHQTRLLPIGGAITISQRGCTRSTSTSKSTAYSSGLATESIGALFTTGKGSSLALELIHGDGRELGSTVVLSLVLVDFVDGHSGVDDVGLNRLLLDDRLDGFVHMVVDVLSSNGGGGGRGMLAFTDCAGVLELGLFGSETLLDV
jgi:hypothetical protein